MKHRIVEETGSTDEELANIYHRASIDEGGSCREITIGIIVLVVAVVVMWFITH